jgi:hypothetical protein
MANLSKENCPDLHAGYLNTHIHGSEVIMRVQRIKMNSESSMAPDYAFLMVYCVKQILLYVIILSNAMMNTWCTGGTAALEFRTFPSSVVVDRIRYCLMAVPQEHFDCLDSGKIRCSPFTVTKC